MRTDFGRWGGHIETFDIYEDWRDERLRLMEAGINPRTGQAIDDMAIFEASPDSKADFATFMWEPVQANFYQGYQYVESQYRRLVGIESVNSFDEVIDKILSRNPNDIGQAMADFITRMIIAFLTSNPNAPDGAAMYSAGRGNLVTVDLSEDSLVDAAVWLRTRKDPDNRPIRASIRSAAVQNDRVALRLRQIINSQLVQYLGVSTTPTPNPNFGRGTANPIAGSDLMPADGVVIDPWLPDANDTIFFADPDVLPAFIVAYLDGQEQPMLGMADATVMHLANSNGNGHDPYTFQGDKIEYKTRHDVGITAVEPLATYKIATP
jgi:hypothetical protein